MAGDSAKKMAGLLASLAQKMVVWRAAKLVEMKATLVYSWVVSMVAAKAEKRDWLVLMKVE